jgi:muconate cycloisomerase
VRIERLEIWDVLIPFRFSFGHALASRASSRNVIVAVRLEDGSVGYGEGVPREYVTGETIQTAFAKVRDEYAPALVGRTLGMTDVLGTLTALRGDLHGARPAPAAAWCAVEMALLDALGKARGAAATAFMGGVGRPRVRYGAVAPFGGRGALAAMLAFFRAYGFSEVKIKVGRHREADVAAVRLARRIMGRNCDLRVDANGAWDADETLRMADRLRAFAVTSYEQPVPARDYAALRRLSRELPEPVIADESLCSLDDARLLVSERACSRFNIRVSKCGGPIGALEIVKVARAAGLACHLGAQVGESGVLTAAGRLVATAALFPAFEHLEGSDNSFLLKRDVTRENLTVRWGGIAPALTGAGIGVHVHHDRLEKMAWHKATVAAHASRDHIDRSA